MSRSFDQLVTRYPDGVRKLASSARGFVGKCLPGVEETVDPTAPVIGYSFGPGYKGMVCTLILSKTGVKIGLAHGSELPDPEGLLEGSGKIHRYIQLESESDFRKAGVRELVKATYAAWKTRERR